MKEKKTLNHCDQGHFSRRTFLQKSGQLSLATMALPAALRADRMNPEHEAGTEYAAGEVTLPFSYSVSPSSLPRVAGLDFPNQPNPDNCQVFVRMGDELWEFRSQWIIGVGSTQRYKGADIDHMTRVEDGTYPEGMTMCWFLGGMWYDDSDGKLYAPMHVEQSGILRSHPVAPWGCRKIILATSTDKGKTWRLEGDIITAETYYYSHDIVKFSGSDYGNGVCDFGFYVDKRGGYLYIFPDEAWMPKGSMAGRWNVLAARCAIGDKMAPGAWRYFYKGKWDEPALGGKSSSVAPSHFWGVIYNSYLDKYICVFPSNQDPVSAKDVDGVFIGACTDLGKQDWVWGYWPEAKFGFLTLTNSEGNDLIECGQSFRYYSYGDKNSFRQLDVKLDHGETKTLNLRPRYLFEPHPESFDPMEGRRTKIVGAKSPEMKYSGNWVEIANADSYEGVIKGSSAAHSSVEFSFEGSDVYWRAARTPQSGRADVYIDGALRKTVDCYNPKSTVYEEFVYIKTGLAPDRKHTIKIVAKGENHPNSGGTAIGHVAIEYSAESYKASAGFCSLMGKNNWHYQAHAGATDTDLQFIPDDTHPKLYWFGEGNCKVGNNYQIADHQAAVRKWVAPHGGVVRIEGKAEPAGGDVVSVGIWQNSAPLWPARVLSSGSPAAHDLTIKVEQGDAISFVAAKKDPATASATPDSAKVTWDPVVTYIKSTPGVWRPNPPSKQNLALGKYARSRTLLSLYHPFEGVDGDVKTTFAIEASDKVSRGDDWFLVDLDQPYRIDRYVLVSQPADPALRPASFTLQASDDGFVWCDIDSVTAHPSDRIDRQVPVFRARYVRIYLPLGKPFAITEFELYYTGKRG
jgi:hypothetical protein